MAVEKETVKAQLKAFIAKTPGVNLSTKRIDAEADRLLQLLPEGADEATVLEAIEARNRYFPYADTAREDDRIRTLEAQVNKTPKPAEPATPQTPNDPTPAPQDKDPLTLMLEEMRALKQDLQGLKAEKQQATIYEQLKTGFGNDVPEDYWGLAPLPKTPDEIPGHVEALKSKYTAFRQKEVNSNLGTGATARGTAGTNSSSSAVKKEVEEFAKGIK